jgi:hypothetical protein
MKKLISQLMMPCSIIMIVFTLSSCHKQPPGSLHYNLDVTLVGTKSFGHIDFRQDPDTAKIVTLDTWVRGLMPNHEYKLQRAVDTILDLNCTSTSWLTLGKGLVPQSIFTNERGSGMEELFRNLGTTPSGKTFDIHFQVIDAVDSAVVLTSDCYQYSVR